jgi:hypothetical protein
MVVDLARHATSVASARAAHIPTHAAHRRKIDCRALDLEEFLSRNEEQRLSRS